MFSSYYSRSVEWHLELLAAWNRNDFCIHYESLWKLKRKIGFYLNRKDYNSYLKSVTNFHLLCSHYVCVFVKSVLYTCRTYLSFLFNIHCWLMITDFFLVGSLLTQLHPKWCNLFVHKHLSICPDFIVFFLFSNYILFAFLFPFCFLFVLKYIPVESFLSSSVIAKLPVIFCQLSRYNWI